MVLLYIAHVPDPFGLALGALLVWLWGPGSWAGPFWFGLGGQGPGPDPFGLAWGARVLGRTGLAWGAKGPGPGRLGSSLFLI